MYAKPFTAVIVSNNANFKPFDVGTLFYHQTHIIFQGFIFIQTPTVIESDSTHNYLFPIGL